MRLIDLGPGDHLCLLYRTEEECWRLLASFIRQGLQRGEKVVCIAGAPAAENLLSLLGDEGERLEKLLGSGQLSILGADVAYGREGLFDPSAMIGSLREEISRALSQGYPCLRVAGEMSWALRGTPGAERLMEYESLLNRFLPGGACLALCQYDMRLFPPETLLKVLDTHPLVSVGTRPCENFYFVPPDQPLEERGASARLERRLRHLKEVSRLEWELEEERQKFALAFFSSPDPKAITRLRDGDHREVNPSFEELTGYRREEALGKNWRELGLFADRPDPEGTAKRPPDGSLRDREVSLRDRQGREHVGLLSAEPLTLGDEECLFAWFKDLTETRRAQEDLLQERDFARGLIESTPAFFVAIDRELRVMMMNRAMLEELGWREDEVAGLPYLPTFVPEEEHGEVGRVFDILLNTDRPTVNVNRVRARDGRELLVEWHGRRVRGGEDGYFFGVGIDITERVRRESEVERLNADLAAFAHTLSHDLKRPLSNALGYAATLRMMLEGRLIPQEEEYLEMTMLSLKGMDGLIEGMLSYTRMEGAQEEAVEVDLSVMLTEILEELRKGGLLKQEVEASAEPLPSVKVDPIRMRQALSNLLSNAAKFGAMAPAPRIEIGVEERPEGTAVFVRDNGPGVPYDQLERIFEPLVRAEDAGDIPGHGLGLAIARRAVESWGGRIWVESERGRGATFYFILP